jgi:HK97 family phage portal protein
VSLFRPGEKRAVQTAADLIPQRGAVSSWSGIPVTPRTALSNPAVWRCWQLICGLISGFPVDAYRKVDGRAVEVEPPTLLTKPSGVVKRRAWMHQAVESELFDGNIVGLIAARDATGYPSQIELQDMGRVSVRQNRTTGAWEWRIGGRDVPSEQIWHVAVNPPAGHILGRSLIEHAAETIAVGIAAQRYGGQFFGDGGHPTMVAKNTEKAINQSVAKVVKQRILDATRGSREPLVIGKGWDVEPWQSNPSESALVDVWASNVSNVANYFGVPAEMLGGKGSSMTYTNLEARALDLLKFCVSLWMSPIEEGLSDSLKPPTFARFNADALLRLDTLGRYRAHEVAIRAGFGTPNERRSLEDLAAVSNGDEIVWPPYRAFPLLTDEEGA